MKEKIFSILEKLDIDYTNYEHAPTHSTTDDKGVAVPGARVKSLLLRNKKSTNYYMVVLPAEKKLEVNAVRNFFEDSKLSFVSAEKMQKLIELEPGHVSPYALVNNRENSIKVLFDADLKEGGLIGFHPLRNDNTIVTDIRNVEKFLEFVGNEYFYGEL